MNTVEALNALGKALCGDSFEVKPGLTDAETIVEIAKNYSGGGSGGGESAFPLFTTLVIDRNNGENNDDVLTSHTWEEITSVADYLRDKSYIPVGCKFTSDTEDPIFVGFAYLVDIDLGPNNEVTGLYFGLAPTALGPSSDREGVGTKFYGGICIYLTNNNLYQDGHLLARISDSPEWFNISYS